MRVSEVNLIVDKLLNRDERGLGKMLIIFGDLNLLTIFKYFFEVVVGYGQTQQS